jgi:DNA-directed RNA polymerase subunit RPC12/RpoP
MEGKEMPSAYKNGDYKCSSCWNDPKRAKSWFKKEEIKKSPTGRNICPQCGTFLRQRKNRPNHMDEEAEIKYAA